MDIFHSTVNAVNEVRATALFVEGVISTIATKEYDEYKADIQLKLDLHLASLQFFQARFLDPEHGLMLPGHLPQWVAETLRDLLLKMKRVWAEYEVLMMKHGLYGSAEGAGDGSSMGNEEWKQLFTEQVKAKVKALKGKGFERSMFDRKKLLKVLDEYKEWSDILRDLMQHFSQEAIYLVTDATCSLNNLNLQGTGLEPVLNRQMLALEKAPEGFRDLDGEVVEDGALSNGFQLAQWKHEGENVRVIVEYHGYDNHLKADDLEPEEASLLKAPLRDLAWLLQNSTFSEDPLGSNQPTIYSLRCLGLIDQVEKERHAFLYNLPSPRIGEEAATTDLVTLHQLISNIDIATKRMAGKLSLGDRFNISYCLALTLLNVHGSRWVHKNIWSRGILLFRQDDAGIKPFVLKASSSSTGPKTTRVVAFLGDWGHARLAQAGTELRRDFEVEPNFYRHPERQGKPTHQFARPHDIYALGVVLLETGLWKTVSQLFDKPIKEAERSGRLPKPKDVRGALIKLAQNELPKEMGDLYAAAVASCLSGDFRDGSEMELSLDFREKVVDNIALGRKL
jgi:hypothetical protein